MASSPVQIALIIVVAVAVLGAVVYFIRYRRTYSGYEEYAGVARTLARALHGELFRDADDLVMSGNWSALPTLIRFSNAENTPGLNIRMQAPATFGVSVLPVGFPEPPAGRPLRTPDAAFDQHFTIRSEQAAEARMFLGPQAIATLKKLCCSSKSFLIITPGAIEHSEMVLPEQETANHILQHLKQISTLVAQIRAMPGSEKVKIQPFERERNVVGRIAIAAGVLAAIITVFTASQLTHQTVPAAIAPVPAGVLPAEGAAIRDINSWQVAQPDDFDGVSAGFIRANGLTPSGRIVGDFSGRGLGNDVVYLLMRSDGSRRVVILTGGMMRYDAVFPSLGGIVRIPKDNVGSIAWMPGGNPAPVDGDGVLLIRNGNDPTSAQALFLRGNTYIFGRPQKYDNINLQ